MKFLKDRQEIAMEINIKGTPVLTIDISKCMNGYADCYEGSKVRLVKKGREDLPIHCTVEMFGDEKENQCHDTPWMYGSIRLGSDMICITSSFGLSDVDEMVEWSNTKCLKAGDKVIVFFRAKDRGYLRVMRIGDTISPFCTTAARLIDIDA